MKKKSESVIAGYNGFLFGLSLAGLMTIAFGTLVESKVLSVLIVSIGATLFGTCFSSAVSRLSGEQTYKKISSFLESTLNTKFVSDEDQLKNFRRIWYHYRVTSIDIQTCLATYKI